MYQVRACYLDDSSPVGETELLLTVPTIKSKLLFLLDSLSADPKVECLEIYYQDSQRGLVLLTRSEFGLGPSEYPKVQ